MTPEHIHKKNPSRTHSTQELTLNSIHFLNNANKICNSLVSYMTVSNYPYYLSSFLRVNKNSVFEIKYKNWNKSVLTEAKDETSLYLSPL